MTGASVLSPVSSTGQRGGGARGGNTGTGGNFGGGLGGKVREHWADHWGTPGEHWLTQEKYNFVQREISRSKRTLDT